MSSTKGITSPASTLVHEDSHQLPTTLPGQEGKLDGNDIALSGSNSGTPPMTSSEVAAMAGNGDGGKVVLLPARPSMISHHSSSVPTTPHQHPRDLTGFRSRSPSPNGDLGSHSPRSVSSEANATLPGLRKSSGGCRYETNVAFGRRRIPYNIGSDMLERIEEEKVKVALEPHEEGKLTGDMRELYDRLLPSPESVEKRKKLVTKLEAILRSEWPADNFKVHVFGSSGNLLYTNDSDGTCITFNRIDRCVADAREVDICIQTKMKKLETMHVLAEVLAKRKSPRPHPQFDWRGLIEQRRHEPRCVRAFRQGADRQDMGSRAPAGLRYQRQ